MAKPAFLASEVKLNFKLRDFFLDLMACIVPGLIFLVTVSIIVGGLFLITSNQLVTQFTQMLNAELKKDTTTGLIYILDSYSFNFWLFLLVTFLSYFAGHLLYRQTPKRPDFASFIRIRDRVITGDEHAASWVIAKGRGVLSKDVQFPYDNLKNYLNERGFAYLVPYADWYGHPGKSAGTEINEGGKAAETLRRRSKTIINRAKIRLAFFFPEHMMNLIRNEAHIRLASSMWYAAKYTIELSYISLFIILLVLFCGRFQKSGFSIWLCLISLGLLFFLFIGKYYKYSAVKIMRGFERNNKSKEDKRQNWLRIERFLFKAAAFLCRLWGEELNVPNFSLISSKEEDKKSGEEKDKERRAKAAAQRIDIRWKIHDHMTLIIFGCLFIFHYYKVFYPTQRPFIIFYLGIITFILIGVLFAKRYIEQTIHYQRVRELIYVLETAHVAHVLEETELPNPLITDKISYDLVIVFKKSKDRESQKEKDKQ